MQMQLIECERLHLKAVTLPCGTTDVCFLPEPCDNIPENVTHQTFKEMRNIKHQHDFNKFFTLKENKKGREDLLRKEHTYNRSTCVDRKKTVSRKTRTQYE